MTIPPVPTLFVECTQTYRDNRNTGIQRVVRNLMRHLPAAGGALGLPMVPLVFEHDRARFVAAEPLLAGRSTPAASRSRLVRAVSRRLSAVRRSDLDRFEAARGSILLLLDASWDLPLWPAIDRFKARGGRVASVIYDLIPLTHPASTVDGLPARFRHWLETQTTRSEAFLCISQATADELRRFMASIGQAPPIAAFPLGSDLDLATPEASLRLPEIFAGTAPVFLVVGSIEPRKRHGFVLDAFELHWRGGGSGVLAILGRQAWRSDALLERIARHPERGRRLHLIRDADDALLDQAYRRAAALIMASEAEGFGLPIVEAFQRGLAVICSDIPVFREVAATGARYFAPDDPAALAALLEAPPAPLPAGHWLGWAESAAAMMATLHRILPPRD